MQALRHRSLRLARCGPIPRFQHCVFVDEITSRTRGVWVHGREPAPWAKSNLPVFATSYFGIFSSPDTWSPVLVSSQEEEAGRAIVLAAGLCWKAGSSCHGEISKPGRKEQEFKKPNHGGIGTLPRDRPCRDRSSNTWPSSNHLSKGGCALGFGRS